MTSEDPRDALFAELHDQFLKPAGYKRRGRSSKLTTREGVVLSIVLESSTWNTVLRSDFGISLVAAHQIYGRNMLVNIPLRRQADPPLQRWTMNEENRVEVSHAVRQAFTCVALPLLERMSTLEGLVSVCADFGPFRFFEARSWCLRRLGRDAEAQQVVRDAIDHAPHDGARQHAERLLLTFSGA